MKTRMFFSLLIAGLLVLAGWEAQAQSFVKKVNCTKGQTITHALQGLDFIPITIQVKGTCSENVEIVRDDVTLKADPLGGTVIGLDPNEPTINVRAFRTVIDGLTISGGRGGITVRGGATIRNCTVQNADRNGIKVYHGGHGTVDNCTVQNNSRHGIYIEGGSATVINSAISLNGVGVGVQSGGSARIGITDVGQYAGNTISSNYGSGIFIYGGGSAYIGGNTIKGNGTDPDSIYGYYGILVHNGSAIVVGNNVITENEGCGIWAFSSFVRIGEPGFGLPTHNTITGNGTGSSRIYPKGGIFGNLGTTLTLNDADVNNNTGNGVTLSACSTLGLSSGVPLPLATVTGNSLFGLQCTDANFCSRFGGNTSGISGNTAGDVSPNCTGF
jgi:parallel beta-helix repeat protein